MRRTKIVCTIGPASSSDAMLEQLVAAGMDVARLNFSHGSLTEHADLIRRIRVAGEKAKRPVAVLQDLQGPKIRLGTFAGDGATIRTGDEFVITTRPVEGTAERASTTYRALAQDVKPGDRVLIDDGLIQLEVLETDGLEVRCRVLEGGTLRDHKGINLPGVAVSAPSLTDKDRDDLLFGIQQGVDWVAISFVRRAADVAEVREVIASVKSDVPVMAKLEKPEAIQDLDEIFALADAVMVARGDLGVEMPLEEVPLIQKSVIRRARERGIPVVVATQMLESMIQHSRPTRAEASDVANAIFDSADAVMLSGETSVGAYPVEAVKVMARIILEAEREVGLSKAARGDARVIGIPDAISEAACHAAEELGLQAIVAFTETGSTARLMAKRRPPVPIIAYTPHRQVQRRLMVVWGVTPRTMAIIENTDEMVRRIDASLLKHELAARGDIIAIVSGSPVGVRGSTNLLKVHRVGERR